MARTKTDTVGKITKKRLSIPKELEKRGLNLINELIKILNDPETSRAQRIRILEDLMEYSYAKRKAVQVTGDESSPILFKMDCGDD